MLKREQGKFCLYSRDGNKKLGCFNTEDEAMKHEARVKAIVAMRQSSRSVTLDMSKMPEAARREETRLDVLVDDEQWTFAVAFEENPDEVIAKAARFSVVEGRFGAPIQFTGKEWEVCIIKEGISKASEGNPPLNWTETALNDPGLHRALEGTRVSTYRYGQRFDHAPLDMVNNGLATKLFDNFSGVLRNVRFGEFTDPTTGKPARGVIGVLHVVDDAIRQKMKSAWDAGSRALGLSVDGDFDVNLITRAINKVLKLKETTLVTYPAAGGNVLALRASQGGYTMYEKLLALLKEKQPALFARLNTAKDDEREKIMDEVIGELVKLGDAGAEALKEAKGLKEKQEADDKAAKEVADKKSADELAAKELAAKSNTEKKAIADTEKLVDTVLLNAPNLPEAVKTEVRASFKDRTATPLEVVQLVGSFQKIAAGTSLRQSNLPLGQSSDDVQMHDAEMDKYIKGLTGMLLGRDMEGVKRFDSLHHSYGVITGRFSSAREMGEAIMESFHPCLPPAGYMKPIKDWHEEVASRKMSMAGSAVAVRQSTLISTTYTTAMGNAMNTYIAQLYKDHALQDWRKVARVGNAKDFKSQIHTRIGGYANLPQVAENAPYPISAHPAEESVNWTVATYGELDFFTRRAFINDNLQVLRDIPKKKIKAAYQTLYDFAFGFIITPGTWSPDSTDIHHANHGNLGSTAIATGLPGVILLFRDQTEPGSGKPLALVPKVLVIPNELEQTAFEKTSDPLSSHAARTETLQNWLSKYGFEVVRVPNWTDATDYFVCCDPNQEEVLEICFLGGKEDPEFFMLDKPDSYYMFTSDQIGAKTRFEFSGGYLDYRTSVKMVVA